MNSKLDGRAITVFASELSEEPITGIVVGTTSSSLALRLITPIVFSDGEIASHLVASVRHEDRSLSEIAENKKVPCGIILVPILRFDPEQPCNLSWWRGRGAATGDVAATA